MPRYKTAQADLPGDPLFWTTVLNQSDIFSYKTVTEGKGGPFGAQLWLVNERENRRVLVGTAEAPEDSNAVLLKQQAGAHAEAENLSPEKRAQVKEFLREHRGENWQVVQVSSGESCPSCRAKQVLFAGELMNEGLIGPDDFHVVFKATYDQARRVAGFSDSLFDQAFRAVGALGVMDRKEGLAGLETALKQNPVTAAQIEMGELVYNPVDYVAVSDVPERADSILWQAGNHPAAVIVAPDGTVLSYSMDERDPAEDPVNMHEKTAIVGALHKAADRLRTELGKSVPWDLEGAALYTNIGEIGPLAYAESLWYNLSGIRIVEDYTSRIADDLAQEMPGVTNRELFRQVAADYDSPVSPLKAAFGGDLPEEANAAHLLWQAKKAMENVKNRQAERLEMLEKGGPVSIELIGGGEMPLQALVRASHRSSDYDGKQASVNFKPG